MKLCILALALVAVAWGYPTGEKSAAEQPAVPLVITDYSSVVKDSEVHPQKDAPESAESNESSESEESSEAKPIAPAKPAAEQKPEPASVDSSEEAPVKKEEAKPEKIPEEPPKKEEPLKKNEEPLKKIEEPLKMNEEPAKPSEEAPKKEEPLKKIEEPAKANDEPAKTNEELLKKTEEPLKKNEEPLKQNEEPLKKNEEPLKKIEEPLKKIEEPAKKSEEPIKEETKPEEAKIEMKTLAHDDEEVPAPIALPTETRTTEVLPQNILEAASQPAAIAEDTIPLTASKREEPAEEKEINQPSLKNPAAEHEIKPVEAKSALPEPTPAVEIIQEIVTEEKKPNEESKIKTEAAEPAQEGRTVRGAAKEDAPQIKEVIEVEKKSEEPIVKKIETPVVEEVKPVVAEEPKPIVEDKTIVKAASLPKIVPAAVSSEESEESNEAKKEEKPLAVEEVPKPLALPSAEETLLKKVETPVEKKEGEIKEPAAVAAAELPKAVS